MFPFSFLLFRHNFLNPYCALFQAVEKAFSVIPGFYWQTLETEDQKCQRAEATHSQECHTEVKESLENAILSFSGHNRL